MRIRLLLPLLLAACDGATDKPVDTDPVDTDTDQPGDSGDTDTDTDTPHAPSAPEITIVPSAPPAGTDFSVTVVTESVDPDGDPVTYTYAWTEDGAARADLTGTTVAGTDTTDGEVWEVIVTPTDGTNVGPAATASVTIGNTAPTAPGLSFSPAEPVDGDTITLVFDPEAADPDGDPLTTSVAWYEDGSLNGIFADATTIDGRYVGGGETFRAVVTVTDGYHDPVTVEASVTVANNPPELLTPRIDPTSPGDDDDLTAITSATDPDGGDVTLSYTWYRDGVEATDVGDTDTVPAASTTVGEEWYVVVTASDGAESVSDASETVTIIPFEGAMYVRRLSATISPDGATLDGTYAADILSYGGWLGDNDCDLHWEMDGITNPRVCPRCDYAFSADFTYDSGSSTVVTGTQCSGLAADGTGSFTFMAGTEDLTSDLYTGGYRYNDFMSFTGTGSYTYGYYGYYFALRHSVTTSTDTAGYTSIYAYYYNVIMY